MFRDLIGEWGQYADWELAEIIINLESELSNALHEQKKRGQKKAGYQSRDRRKSEILAILSGGGVYTTSQIAKVLHVSASGHLRNILCELFQAHKIFGIASGTVASHPVYYWSISEAVYNSVTGGLHDGGWSVAVGLAEGQFEAEGR